MVGGKPLRQIHHACANHYLSDNPASDIAGANGASWKSILVHTGVYDPTQGDQRSPPKSDDVSNSED